jgi:short-subunit dehydrogenase
LKRVIVVGATDGIGRALADAYASQGFWVTVVGRNAQKLEGVVGDLKARHPVASVHGVTCDLRDSTALEPAFRAAIVADDGEIFQVNTVAAVQMLGLAANYFRLAGKGQLVGISSIAGDRGRKANPAYCASKAALSTYLEGLRWRLAPFNVQVTTVKPGFVRTKMIAGRTGVFWAATPEEAAQAIARRVSRGHEVFYVYGRWALVAAVMKAMPAFLFKRFGPP